MKELRTALPYFRPYKAGVVAGLVMVVVTNVFGILAPFFLGEAIDQGLNGGSMGQILRFAGLIILVTTLGGVAKFGMRQLLNSISRKIECDLRNDFFQHLLRLDAAFYGRTRTGDLMARCTHDTLAVRAAVGPAIMYAANTAVGFAFALSFMLWISPHLTLYVVIPMVALPVIVLGFARVIHARFEEIQEQFSSLSTMVQENLTGVRIVRAYVQEPAQAIQFEGMNREYMARNMGLVKVAGLFHPILALFSGVAMVILVWVGGLEVMAGRLSVSDFIEFGIYLQMLIWPLIALGWVVNLFQRGAASMGRINKIMNTKPQITSPEEPEPLLDPRGEIEFRGVSFRYPGTERLVLDDVSFTAVAGQTVAVVGPTGAGKSTLLSLLPRMYDPEDGEVLLDGVPLRSYDLVDLRRVIGMVPQDPFLFSTTIRDNIALGLGSEERITHRTPEGPSEDPDQAVAEAARIAQLDDSIQDFPMGYDTLLGERGINLSGGQKQRATLARAVARDPTVLILDDALSAVDTHTEAAILDDLKAVMEGRTSFIISHRVSAVMDADLILVLDEGRIVERGRHADLVALGGTYATLLRRQMLEHDLESEAVGAVSD